MYVLMENVLFYGKDAKVPLNLNARISRGTVTYGSPTSRSTSRAINIG
jgi:hypothetical protein